MANLQILRNPSAPAIIVEIPINDNMVFSRYLMQEHRITLTNFVSKVPLPIQLNDYVMHKGIKYTINTVPDVLITNEYAYTIIFEGPEYTLYDVLLFDEGVIDFPYFGTAEEHLLLLLTNINAVYPGWTMGAVHVTEPQFIQYSGVSCRVALSMIADAFKCEYFFVDKEINIVKQAGSATAYSFEYGIHKGLYSLTRKYVNEENVKTKIFGFGSTRNLPADYRGGLTRLVFNDRFKENNAVLYGIKQAAYTNDEIYPTREGALSAASVITDLTESFTVADSTMDFNLNDHLLAGVNAKLIFVSGDLTGETFDITNYDNATKTFTLKAFVNSSNVKLPSPAFKPEIGNTYKLLDISLPTAYITAAETKLEAETFNYTLENSIPRVEYALDMDVLYTISNSIDLLPGDIVNIKNPSLGIDNDIRVIAINYPLTYPTVLSSETKYSVTIANFVPYNVQDRAAAQIKQNQNVIRTVDKRSVEAARRNSANFRKLQELLVDPDNYFNTASIKPGSIETLMLAVGAKSQNFRLIDAVFEINFEGDPNDLKISGTTLEHLEIEIPTVGYSWVIPTRTFLDMDPTKHYYIYAKCSKVDLTGTWEISETPVLTEQTVGFYNFNIGILYKVKDGYRDKDLTFGTTTVVGENVTTGKIKDITGVNFFDLLTGSFNLGDATSGIDYNVTTPGTLTIKGDIIAELASLVDLVVKNLQTNDSGKRVVINSETNSVKVYDVDDKLIIYIDDNAAVNSGATYQSFSEVYDENGNPTWLYIIDVGGGVFKYVYPDKDMGISIGLGINDSGGFTAIGRNEVYTTGRFKAMVPDQTYGSVMSEQGFQYIDLVTTSRVKKGILVDVSGSTTENTAADLTGVVKIDGDIKIGSSEKVGVTAARDMQSTIGNVHMEFTNGICTRFEVF